MFIKFTVGMMILALWLFLSFPEPKTVETKPVLQQPVTTNTLHAYTE